MTEEALAPELTTFIDAGQRTVAALLGRSRQPLQEVLAAFEVSAAAARNFLDRSTRQLDRVCAAVAPEDPRQHVVNEMRRAFERSTSTIDAMLEAVSSDNLSVLQSALGALEESVANLQECARTLQSMDQETRAILPFPSLERLLAGVRSQQEGLATAEAVNALLLAAVAHVARLDRQVRLFAAAHPDRRHLADDALSLTGLLAEGLGALAQSLESQEGLMEAAMQLSAAWPLAGLLREMEQVTATSKNFSRFTALEECSVYLSRQTDMPPAERPSLDRAAVERTEVLCEVFQQQLQSYQRLPLAFVVGDPLQRAQDSLQDLERHVAYFRQTIGRADATTMLGLCTLRDASEATRAALHEVRAEMQAALDRTEAFPRLELLRERVGRMLAGTISLKHFLVDFSALASQLEQLYSQARAQGKSGAVLAGLLERQRGGFETISQYFQDQDAEHLRDGWRQVEETLGPLQVLRRTLPERSLRPRGLSEALPDLLVRLTEWRTAMDQGALTPSAVRSRVRDEVHRLKDLRNEANSRFKRLWNSYLTSSIQSAMQGYLDNISELMAALEVMERGLGSHDPGGIRDGFERARTAIMAMEMEVHQLAG